MAHGHGVYVCLEKQYETRDESSGDIEHGMKFRGVTRNMSLCGQTIESEIEIPIYNLCLFLCTDTYSPMLYAHRCQRNHLVRAVF